MNALFTRNTGKKLESLRFKLVDAVDDGMHKALIWANDQMKFSLVCDRGYYDSYIEPIDIAEHYMDIIWLLRFIKKNSEFYEKELELAGLSNTLPPEEYVDLLYANYNLIADFMKSFKEEDYLAFKKFPNN